MSLSVRQRILWGNAAFASLALLLFTLAVRFLTAKLLHSALDRTLFDQALPLAQPLAAAPPPLRPGGQRLPVPLPFSPDTVTLIAPRRLPVRQDGPLPLSQSSFERAIQGELVYADEEVEGWPVRILSMPVRADDGSIIAVIQTGARLTSLAIALRGVDQALLLLSPMALLICLSGAALLTHRALAPVRALTDAAEQLAATDLTHRLPEPGGDDELDRQAKVLNRMLARLEASFTRQKRFTADASHELRTPLAVIKATTSLLLESELSASQRQALTGADEAADRAAHLVSDLLLLARTENGTLRVARQEVLLSDPLQCALTDARALHEGLAAPVLLNIPENLHVHTDPQLLVRLLSNLLSNALRHTTAEGKVVVEAALGTSTLILTITDTGEGIAPEHLEKLGQPFYRPDTARARTHGGAGLGLSLCQGIVTALQGELRVESKLAHGTRVTLTLPL